jgi:hypothetical protein
MISLDQCKHGWVYKTHSRNLAYGVFNKEISGFVGLREKFGHVFLFVEFHWDTGAPCGTVHPECEIEECPVKNLRERLDDICHDCRKKVEFVKTDQPGEGNGVWRHTEETPCLKARPVSPQNDELYEYLLALEKREEGRNRG